MALNQYPELLPPPLLLFFWHCWASAAPLAPYAANGHHETTMSSGLSIVLCLASCTADTHIQTTGTAGLHWTTTRCRRLFITFRILFFVLSQALAFLSKPQPTGQSVISSVKIIFSSQRPSVHVGEETYEWTAQRWRSPRLWWREMKEIVPPVFSGSSTLSAERLQGSLGSWCHVHGGLQTNQGSEGWSVFSDGKHGCWHTKWGMLGFSLECV